MNAYIVVLTFIVLVLIATEIHYQLAKRGELDEDN